MRTFLTLGAACVAATVLTLALPESALAQPGLAARLTGGKDPFQASIGLGAEYAPEYEGAKKSAAGALPSLDLAYRTESFGSFALGTSVGGLAWIPVQNPIYSLALLVSYDGGRKDDEDGGGLTRGSKRLRGLGDVKGTVLYGGFGSITVADTSVNLVLLKAPSGRGHGGGFGTLSADVPFTLGGLEFALTPSVNFADRKYMQAYFGVTPLQSQRSGLRVYQAKAGLKSYGLGLSTEVPLDDHWSLFANLAVDRLAGDAAKSPIVERRVQPSFALGVSYGF